MSKTQSHGGVDAIARDELVAGTHNAHRQIRAGLGAQFASPGEIDLWPQIDARVGGIVQLRAADGVLAFGFARHDGLQRERVVVLQRQKHARPPGPRKLIRVLIIEVAFAANGVLRAAVRKNFLQRSKISVPTNPSTEPEPSARSWPPMPAAKSSSAGLRWLASPVGNFTPPLTVQFNVKSSVRFRQTRKFPINETSPIPVSLPRAPVLP